MVSIESIMHTPLVTAEASEAVSEVAQRMRDAAVGAVVIVEGNTLVGIFTERDLLTTVVAEGRDPKGTRIGDVATREVLSVEKGAPLRQCAEALRDRGVRHLPVVEDGRPVGILSARDFFGAVSDGLERFIERARYDEELRAEVDPYDHIGGGYGR
jgi:CBS domain-containing protein